MCFFVAQLTALIMFNVMRLLQKERAHQDALFKASSTSGCQRAANAANDGAVFGEGLGDRGRRKNASAGYAISSPLAPAPTGHFDRINDGIDKGQERVLIEGSSDSSLATTSRADETSSSDGSATHRHVRSDDPGDELVEVPSGGLTRDHLKRQENRDLRRAAVVLPAAGLCLGAFWWLWSVGPFIRFDTSGLLGPYIIDNGPHLELGLKR